MLSVYVNCQLSNANLRYKKLSKNKNEIKKPTHVTPFAHSKENDYAWVKVINKYFMILELDTHRYTVLRWFGSNESWTVDKIP